MDFRDRLRAREIFRGGRHPKKLASAIAWRLDFPKATPGGCLECKEARGTNAPCNLCPFEYLPKLGEREHEILRIWQIVSLPVVKECGLQNIFHALELERPTWSKEEIEIAIMGLNKIHDILYRYEHRDSPNKQ